MGEEVLTSARSIAREAGLSILSLRLHHQNLLIVIVEASLQMLVWIWEGGGGEAYSIINLRLVENWDSNPNGDACNSYWNRHYLQFYFHIFTFSYRITLKWNKTG